MKQVEITMYDELNDEMVTRNVTMLSEFYTGTEQYRRTVIEDWITDRAEPQHNTLLFFESYRIIH